MLIASCWEVQTGLVQTHWPPFPPPPARVCACLPRGRLHRSPDKLLAAKNELPAYQKLRVMYR